MGHRILIVDDSPDDIELTTIALETAGLEMSVDSIMDGEEALEFLQTGNCLPGLILLDLKMAGMSGIEFLRAIKADDRLKELPVVVVTSSCLESDRSEAYRAGADSFMQKAFDLAQFSKDIRSILERWLLN